VHGKVVVCSVGRGPFLAPTCAPHPPHLARLQVAPTKLRGTLGTINQLLICTGILAVLCVNVAMPVTEWRSFFLLGSIPAVLLALGEGHLPAPVWTGLALSEGTKPAAQAPPCGAPLHAWETGSSSAQRCRHAAGVG